MNDLYFRKIMTTIILIVLLVLSFFLVKPIILSIIIGLILAFIFNPTYDWLRKKIPSKNLSAFIICIFLITLIVLPFWFLTPIFIDQSFKVYLAAQQTDFVKPIKAIFPSLFASDEFSVEIASILHSFVTRTANAFVNFLSQFILNFPNLFLQTIVVFFTFFFVLRDKNQFISYIKSLLPFSKEVEKKLFEYSKGITSSVIYGQIVVGFIQGLLVGLGFYIFKVPNALFLTLLACLAGIFPIIGVTIVWLPVIIYMFVAGSLFPAIGVTIFGVVSSSIDNLLKPVIVSRRTQMHSSIILIGMIGGLFLFGILGFILGPLILAYLLIILEIYRNIKTPGIFIRQN